MKKWMRIGIALLAVAVGWIIFKVVDRTSVEPQVRYHMSYVGDWRIDRRDTAAAELKKLGPKGVRILVSICERPESRLHRSWISVYSQIPGFLQQILPAPANLDRDRIQALTALGVVGPLPAWAFPVLRRALQDKNKEFRCLALAALGKAGLDGNQAAIAVGELCQDGNEEVRQQAVEALLNLGPAAHAAYPALRRALEQSDPAIGPGAAVAIPQLTRMLSQSEPNLRAYVPLALTHIDPSGTTVAPILMAALGDTNETVRSASVYGLARLKLRDPAFVPVLRRLLSDPGPTVRIAAVRALIKYDIREPETFVPLLLHDGTNAMKNEMPVVTALGELGPGAKKAVPWLRSQIASTDVNIRFYATRSLWQITGEAEPAITVLPEFMPDKRSFGFFLCEAARILGQIGPAAQSAVPILSRRAKCYPSEMRQVNHRTRLAEDDLYPSYFAAEAWWKIAHRVPITKAPCQPES